MVLLSVELSQLINISERNFSRTELGEIKTDHDIRIHNKCKESCKKHCHGVAMETSKMCYMSTLSNIFTLPQRVVLESALKTVNNFQVMFELV